MMRRRRRRRLTTQNCSGVVRIFKRGKGSK